jgi:hypothetical protein
MRVTSFLATLPPKQLAAAATQPGANQKIETLKAFAQGVTVAGDQGFVRQEMCYSDCDVAVMLGWVHENGKKAAHLSFRQTLLEQQRQLNRRTVIIDSNLFLYRDVSNPRNYLRYSFDGVFPDTGEYCDRRPDAARWDVIRSEMGLELRPWRNTGGHILLCLQREGGWSMRGNSVVDWAAAVILELRKYTDRPIRIRAHPGDKKSRSYLGQFKPVGALKKVGLSDPAHSLLQDLQDCWAVVNHNSSPAVGAAIEGIPVFVTDAARSQARDIANIDLSQIEKPNLPDRDRWVRRLAQFHWSQDDLMSGRCWQHMRQWVRTS